MEKQEQREKEAEEAINAINKKTGRNMPQAIATAVVLIAIILACLLISVDLFVYLVVLFNGARIVGAARRFSPPRDCIFPWWRCGQCSAVTFAGHLLQQASYCGYEVCVLASLLLVAMPQVPR